MFIITAITTGLLSAETKKLIVSFSSAIIFIHFYAAVTDTAISSPGCEYQFGIYPDSGSCSQSYVKCEYGVPHQQPCEPGLVYDHRIHKCNWPDQNLEQCNPECNAV